MKEKGIYFLLFSYSSKNPKKISFSKDDYEICGNDIRIGSLNTIEYYEIYKRSVDSFFSSNEIKVKINDTIIRFKTKSKDNQFIFNDELIRKEYNKVGFNNLNNEEEFNFFYRFLCKKHANNKKYFALLIKSILEII